MFLIEMSEEEEKILNTCCGSTNKGQMHRQNAIAVLERFDTGV